MPHTPIWDVIGVKGSTTAVKEDMLYILSMGYVTDPTLLNGAVRIWVRFVSSYLLHWKYSTFVKHAWYFMAREQWKANTKWHVSPERMHSGKQLCDRLAWILTLSPNFSATHSTFPCTSKAPHSRVTVCKYNTKLCIDSDTPRTISSCYLDEICWVLMEDCPECAGVNLLDAKRSFRRPESLSRSHKHPPFTFSAVVCCPIQQLLQCSCLHLALIQPIRSHSVNILKAQHRIVVGSPQGQMESIRTRAILFIRWAGVVHGCV